VIEIIFHVAVIAATYCIAVFVFGLFLLMGALIEILGARKPENHPELFPFEPTGRASRPERKTTLSNPRGGLRDPKERQPFRTRGAGFEIRDSKERTLSKGSSQKSAPSKMKGRTDEEECTPQDDGGTDLWDALFILGGAGFFFTTGRRRVDDVTVAAGCCYGKGKRI